MRGVTLRQLRAFSLVSRHHSFAQAAAELHLTPSAVSLQIKELEQAVGMPLFGRQARGTSLTRAGELLLPDALRALEALAHAEASLGRLRHEASACVSVGMVSSAKYFLPRLLARFHERRTDLQLHLQEANREQLLERLRSGEIDLAVMGAPPHELQARAEPFAALPLGVLAAPEHALAGERAIPLASLVEHRFLVREPGSGTRAAMERCFSECQLPLPPMTELHGNSAIKEAVMANLGLAFLSLHAAALELQERLLVALDVQGLPLLRRWYVVRTGAPRPADAAAALARFIVDEGSESFARPFRPPGGAPRAAAPVG